ELIIEAWRDYFQALKEDLEIGHFTLDNAANNSTAMTELSRLLQRRGIDFNSQDLHIMCLPHVLNICSKHATDDFTSADFSSILESLFEFPNSSINKRTYVEALRKDPAARAHIGLWKLSEADWIILEDLEMVLEVPHCAQQTMSGERTPLLGNVVPTFEMFIAQWQALGKQLPWCAPYIDAGLNCARKYYERMGKTRAYTIAMLVNPSIHLTWIMHHWSDVEKTSARQMIVEMETYKARIPETSNAPPPPQQRAAQSCLLTARLNLLTMNIVQWVSGIQTVEQELSAYLATEVAAGTDPLAFWHVSRSTFPTLFQIAMDYLPIQASSVPCERVFSSSAETMTKRRNRISPILMEALQMTKFFLTKERLDFMDRW
ncbi:hypothetical protein SCLCIDRAFT_50902, partial [Scleroderma citrinum Foug A]